MTVERIAGIGAFAVVVAGVAIGFAAIGPPQHIRLIELDRRRTSNLQSIERRIRSDDQGRRAGQTVTAPARPRDDWPRDPLTGKPYDYRRESATRYRLCATFALGSDADGTDDGARWHHGAGRTCYRVDLSSSADQPEQVSTTVAL